ncbi:MAG: hypothetical protein HOP15_06050 [Planctomycetes bacterium]|nr:hypothetical protein [Planctomycetota bacterium]
MRNLLVFVLAVLLGGALVFVLSRVKRNETPAATENVPAPLLALAEPEIDSAKRPAHKPAPEREPSKPAAELAKPAPGPTSLAGTIVVLDEHGGKYAGEDGILALGLGLDGARTHREIWVQDGRWSLPLVAPGDGGRIGSMALRACVLGKRVAVPAPGQAADLAIPADGQVELRVRWQAAPQLHVRARDTGRELEEVTLYELPLTQRGSPLDVQHPGPNAKSLGRAVGPSPVRLEVGESDGLGLASRVLFAKSPGYGWGRIEVDPSAEEEPTLLLDPAGALELEVVSEPWDTTLEILLLEAEPPHAEVLDVPRGDAKSFLFEDLRAGRYLAQARHSGLLVGALEVEVAAGKRAKAVLTVGPPPSIDVPFEGVLVVPEELKLDDFMLEFLLQGRFDDTSLTRGSFEIRRSEMALEKGSRERYRWSAPSARSARYQVLLFPTPFGTELDTGPAGTRDARIEVPRLCLVSLRCIDEQSEANVSSERVSFAALTPRAFVARLPKRLAGGSPPSREFRAPQGRVLIFTTPVLYEPAARIVEVGPGTNEVLLFLRKKP